MEVMVAVKNQGCDLRTPRVRFTYPRESLTREVLKIHFKRYLRGNHVWYIYGNILRYTVNTGDSVPFLVVGGRRAVVSSSFVCGVVRLPFSLFSLSLFAPFPPALCVRLQLQCYSPWTMVVRIQTFAKRY